jgi:hypothetical protein
MTLRALKVFLCLILIQVSFIFAAQADEALDPSSLINPSMSIKTDKVELEYLLDLSLRVMLDKPLYNFINEAFTSKTDGTPMLSQTKILFILAQVKEDWESIEKYLDFNPNKLKPPNSSRPPVANNSNTPDPARALDKELFNGIMAKVKDNAELVNILKSNIAVSQPLLVEDKRNGYTFNSIEFTANHDRYDDADKKTPKVIPAVDQRQVMIDLVDSLKAGDRFFFNFYDFDMEELADAIIAAKKRGVDIMGGVDSKVYSEKPAAKLVIDKMLAAKLRIQIVDSVGLNHQKLMAGIRKNGKSFAMFGSGNATQSCNGPEGDLKMVPPESRPDFSKPNPNHITIVDGIYAALIVASEIKKHVVYQLRGQSGFPVGGAFMLNGKPQKNSQDNEKMLLGFSPNGGMGDINRDIYSRFFKIANGPIEGAVFSMSSLELGKDMADAIVREIKQRRLEGKPATDLWKVVGDAQFAMRDYSVLLKLSGYKMIEYEIADPFTLPKSEIINDPEKFVEPEPPGKKVKVFIEDLKNPLVQEIHSLLTPEEWANWRSNIRISPKWFREQHFPWEGVNHASQVKLHYKGMALAKLNITNAGSSINFSNAGEANQEQIVIILSRKIAKAFRGALRYLFDMFSSPDLAIHQEVNRRMERVKPEQIRLALEAEKFREELKAGNKSVLCRRVYWSPPIAK